MIMGINPGGASKEQCHPDIQHGDPPVVIASADHFIATVVFKYICLINFPRSSAQDVLDIPFDLTTDPMNSLAIPSKFLNESQGIPEN